MKGKDQNNIAQTIYHFCLSREEIIKLKKFEFLKLENLKKNCKKYFQRFFFKKNFKIKNCKNYLEFYFQK